MDTTQFLDYLSEHDATAGLGESLTELVFARRTAEARRVILTQHENQQVSVAS